MAAITGSSVAEIDASIDVVWKVVEDVLSAPDWQGGLKDIVELERDEEGHVTRVESFSDAKVRTIKSVVRFEYERPTRLRWSQVEGELKSVEGSWELAELGAGRTRATYSLDVELGRMLGMVIRGPLVDVLRGQLVNARAGELEQHVEGG